MNHMFEFVTSAGMKVSRQIFSGSREVAKELAEHFIGEVLDGSDFIVDFA